MININYSNIICTQFYLVEKNVLVLSKPGKTTVLSHFLTENHSLGIARLWFFTCGGDDTRKPCGIPPSSKFPEYKVFSNLWLISERVNRYLAKASLVERQALHVFAANERSK